MIDIQSSCKPIHLYKQLRFEPTRSLVLWISPAHCTQRVYLVYKYRAWGVERRLQRKVRLEVYLLVWTATRLRSQCLLFKYGIEFGICFYNDLKFFDKTLEKIRRLHAFPKFALLNHKKLCRTTKGNNHRWRRPIRVKIRAELKSPIQTKVEISSKSRQAYMHG